jgi:hypothetical protein
MSEPTRHHYIPVFYLKPWTGSDGRLCEFSKPYKEFRARRKHPAATSYVDGLYTVPGLPPEDAQFVERDFMQAVDSWAAQAQRVFLQNNRDEQDLTSNQYVAWARFIYALMLRNPEHIDKMVHDAVAKYEYGGPVQGLLPDFINSTSVIKVLSNMSFHTFLFEKGKHTLLTSDRPIVMTDGIMVDGAHLLIPLSPHVLFMASRDRKTVDRIADLPQDEIIEAINDRVCSQARKFVYGVDDSQFRFVHNRFGKRIRSSPFDV